MIKIKQVIGQIFLKTIKLKVLSQKFHYICSMIQFNRFQLKNGLTVLVHHDDATPFVVVNLTYKVGAKHEDESRTGFAHLFEHLMFGGSKNAPVFDRPLELAGAINNAFTNNDITNYYEMIPKENLEVALWLESDRMNNLLINENSLNVQRKVVIEEFKERYLNKPYGETWHYLRELAYKEHPYKWPTIGKTVQHIEEASLEDVQEFYNRFYSPNNAILTLAGDITEIEAQRLVEKYFGHISATETEKNEILPEPKQQEARTKTVVADVPANCIYMAFHMPARGEENYYECDLISDVLSNGESARLFQHLVKEQQLFSSMNAYILGSFENGLFVITGHLADGVNQEQAEQAIWEQINLLIKNPPTAEELQKVKNKVEANLTYQLMSVMNKALNLAFYEVMGNAEDVNFEQEKYQAVTVESFHKVAQQLFKKENSNTLWQLKQNN